jgi:hypothetical protein
LVPSEEGAISFDIQGLSPIARPGHFLARSTSHSVAVHDGCTNIPLAAGGAQEDEAILEGGFLRALTR